MVCIDYFGANSIRQVSSPDCNVRALCCAALLCCYYSQVSDSLKLLIAREIDDPDALPSFRSTWQIEESISKLSSRRLLDAARVKPQITIAWAIVKHLNEQARGGQNPMKCDRNGYVGFRVLVYIYMYRERCMKNAKVDKRLVR